MKQAINKVYKVISNAFSFDNNLKQKKKIVEMNNLYTLPETMSLDGKSVIAQDVNYNNISNDYYFDYDKDINLLLGRGRLPYPLLGLLLENGIFNKMCNILSMDATSKGIELYADDDTPQTGERIKIINNRLKELDVMNWMRIAKFKSCAFGGCLLYPKLLGDDIPHDNDVGTTERENQLFLDPTKKIFIEYLQIVEPLYVVPQPWNSINPLDKDFYEPDIYNIMTTKIHKSRIIKFTHTEIGNIYKPRYNFFSPGLIQLTLEYVLRFEKSSTNITDLTSKAILNVLKTNLAAIFNGGDGSSFKARVDGFINTADSRGVLAIDKDTEDFVQIVTQFAGLSDLQQRAAEYMTMVTGMPITRFLGTSPGGLNSTGTGDLTNYYDYIEAMQEKEFRIPFEFIIKLIMLEQFNEIDESIKLKFIPLWQDDLLKNAQVESARAQTDALRIDKGIITSQEAREKIINDPLSGYGNLPEDNEDLPSPEDIDNLPDDDDDETYNPLNKLND